MSGLTDRTELTCLVNTGPHGAHTKFALVPWQMVEGQRIEVTDCRKDSPGARFMTRYGEVRNFDYPHRVNGVTLHPMKSYR